MDKNPTKVFSDEELLLSFATAAATKLASISHPIPTAAYIYDFARAMLREHKTSLEIIRKQND